MHPPREWFVKRGFGLNFKPVTWEGWLATLVLVVVIIGIIATASQLG